MNFKKSRKRRIKEFIDWITGGWKIMLLIVLVPVAVCGQKIYVSPTSIGMWGQAPGIASASFSYGEFEATYLLAYKTMSDKNGGIMKGGYGGLFWKPLKISWKRLEAKGGAGYLFRKFPTINGTNFNFSAGLTFKITDSIGIRYNHISNGFGLLNELNPGIDNIGLQVSL